MLLTAPTRTSGVLAAVTSARAPTSTVSIDDSGTVVVTTKPSSPITVTTALVDDAATVSPAAIEIAATGPAIGLVRALRVAASWAIARSASARASRVPCAVLAVVWSVSTWPITAWQRRWDAGRCRPQHHAMNHL